MIPGAFQSVGIDADASHRHVNETWEQIKLQISNRPEVFLAQKNRKAGPELKCQFSIDLCVGAYVHGRHLPHLSLRIDTKLTGGLD